MSDDPTYQSEDPVAACIGEELEDHYQIYVLIDVDLEVPYLVPKTFVKEEFRKYGLPVWLMVDEQGEFRIEKRKIKVTPELIKEREEMDKLIESFNE